MQKLKQLWPKEGRALGGSAELGRYGFEELERQKVIFLMFRYGLVRQARSFITGNDRFYNLNPLNFSVLRRP